MVHGAEMEFAAAAAAVAAYSQDGVRAAFHELRRDTRGTELEVIIAGALFLAGELTFSCGICAGWAPSDAGSLDPAAALAQTRFSMHLCTRACRIVPLSSLHAAWLAPNQI